MGRALGIQDQMHSEKYCSETILTFWCCQNWTIGNLSQAQELQEEQDAVYEAKHNAKEGSRKMFKKATAKKPVVSKAKKPDVQVAEADSTFGKNLPLAPIFNKVGTKSKHSSQHSFNCMCICKSRCLVG